MNERFTLQERLEQLGSELRSRPSVAERVMQTVENIPAFTQQRVQHQSSPRRNLGRRFVVLSGLAAGLAAVIAFVWLSQPDSLYARAMAALGRAETIHVTGWTTRIVRKWPLENGDRVDSGQKHAVEGWFWTTQDDVPRSWRKMGPVTQNEIGGSLQEYQADADLLFTRQGDSDDHLEQFSALATYLKALDRQGMRKESLGTREVNGKMLKGLKIIEGNRSSEYWFDAEKDLPVMYTQTETVDDGTDDRFELHFEYNLPVPEQVASWKPPAAKNRRYGSGHKLQQAWKDHVAAVGERLHLEGGNASIRLLDRDSQRFSLQYQMKTPDGRWWVLPIALDQYAPIDLQHFIRLHAARFTPLESWRAPQDLLDMQFKRQDLVFREDVSWEEWVQFVLNAYDLEYVDRIEDRMVWVAHHDGRELKPWNQVQPPVPYIVEGGIEKKGVVRPGIGFKLTPVTLQTLFEDFTDLQNHYLTADGPIIDDQTGLPKPPVWDRDVYKTAKAYAEQVTSKYHVATDSPWFAGGPHADESQRLARDWYRTQFGITFTEETRPLTVHTIRRKEK